MSNLFQAINISIENQSGVVISTLLPAPSALINVNTSSATLSLGSLSPTTDTGHSLTVPLSVQLIVSL